MKIVLHGYYNCILLDKVHQFIIHMKIFWAKKFLIALQLWNFFQD